MEQLSSLVHLDGYGAYVWPAYGVAALVLIGLLWWTMRGLRANERLLARLQTGAPERRAATAAVPPRPEAAH
jgi:heme exporter protein D